MFAEGSGRVIFARKSEKRIFVIGLNPSICLYLSIRIIRHILLNIQCLHFSQSDCNLSRCLQMHPYKSSILLI